MTTAQYRQIAMEHEAKLEWGRALDAWQKAIDAYPPRSAIGNRDVALMQERLEACRSAYFPA